MKKKIILLVLLLSIFMIGAVSASSDTNDTADSKLTNNAQKHTITKQINKANNEVVKSKTTSSSKSESTTSSSKETVPKGYVLSKKVYYHAINEVYFGWKGYFNGYFRIYKDHKQVYSLHVKGYYQDYGYLTKDLELGTHTAKLITKGKTIAKGKIIVQKSASKISVEPVTAYTGNNIRCYAYVLNKKDENYLNGGYVEFKLKDKTYKAKVKDGVAIAKFKVTLKPGKYTVQAKYIGGKNIKSSKTKFKMVVKSKKA